MPDRMKFLFCFIRNFNINVEFIHYYTNTNTIVLKILDSPSFAILHVIF